MFLAFKMEGNSWQQMGKVPYGSCLFFISVAIRILPHNKTMMSLTVSKYLKTSDTCGSDSNKCDILILNKRNMSTFEDLYNSPK